MPNNQSNSVWELANTNNIKQANTVKASDSALLVIDYQNFCANKKGFLGKLFEDKNHTVENTKKAIDKARKVAVPIIYLNTMLNSKLFPKTDLFKNLNNMIPWNKLSKQDLVWNFAIIDN